MYHSLFTPSPVEERLAYFQIVAIINKATKNIHVQDFVQNWNTFENFKMLRQTECQDTKYRLDIWILSSEHTSHHPRWSGSCVYLPVYYQPPLVLYKLQESRQPPPNNPIFCSPLSSQAHNSSRHTAGIQKHFFKKWSSLNTRNLFSTLE